MQNNNMLSLNETDTIIFKQHFPNYSEDDMERLKVDVVYVYNRSHETIRRLIAKGFSKDFQQIVAQEWILYITKIIQIIEQMSITSGKEKLDVLTGVSVLIIFSELPINDETKKILGSLLREFIPDVVNAVISVSKKLHVSCKHWIKSKNKSSCCKL